MKRKYQFKSNAGPHRDRYGTLYGPEDIIKLTAIEAESLLFKLDPLFKDEPEPEPEPKVKLRIEGVEEGYNVIIETSGEKINDAPLKLGQAKVLAGNDTEIIEWVQPPDEIVDPAPLVAKHKGGGKWNIVWEETGTPLTTALYTRAEVSEILKKIKDGSMTVNDLVD